MHDPSHWAKSFMPLLENPEFHLAEHFKTNFAPLYWLMRLNGAVLEVGCGSARGVILVKRLQPPRRVVGLDVSLEVCKLARKYTEMTNVDVEIVEGNAFKLPFANDEFGVAFSSGLFEHYDDDKIIALTREQLRVARHAVASVPTEHYYYQRSREYGDERMIGKAEWLGLFEKAGRVVDFSTSGNPMEENTITAVVTRR